LDESTLYSRIRFGLHDRRVAIFVVFTTVSTLIVTTAVARIELTLDHGAVNWWAFSLFGVLLVLAESRPSLSLRFGEGGEITPGWAFAFALVLLGSPLGAVACSAVATLIADLVVRKSFLKILFNVSQVSLSLGLGALVLHVSGLDGPALSHGDISFVQSLGMILAGCVVLMTSAMSLFMVMSLSQGISLWIPVREGWLMSVSADGALLAMAPIFVVAVGYSLLLLPMLGVTSFIVYTSARQAIRQAHAASHDPLTNLCNRSAFSLALEQRLSAADAGADSAARSSGSRPHGEVERTTLLLIDLDGFKEVNDRLGHATGDALLTAFAARMERTIPAGAIAARLGGDEFAVLLEGGGLPEQQLAVAHELRSKLSTSLQVDGFPLSIGMSVGVACAPDHGNTAEELLRCADAAMYRAKRFRTGVETYGTVGATRERGRIGLLGALSEAIEDNQLTLSYQPQMRMGSGTCDGVEALLRWRHPTLGSIPPGDFIAVAEHTDLIVPLTQFVLERAIADIVVLDQPGVSVAVNISARNLQDRHFPDVVMRTLAGSGLSPQRLELEITETAIASDPERSRFAIDSLREAGVRISIDDFGTGYSSFVSLRDLEVDRLKIDRSFISRLASGAKDAVLVRSIIAMAAELGLETVAEGIEDAATWELLQSLGCDVGQGFLLSYPLTFVEVSAWLPSKLILPKLSTMTLAAAPSQLSHVSGSLLAAGSSPTTLAG
jgi:diguanylate cyclase (GGDEF)-like protein